MAHLMSANPILSIPAHQTCDQNITTAKYHHALVGGTCTDTIQQSRYGLNVLIVVINTLWVMLTKAQV